MLNIFYDPWVIAVNLLQLLSSIGWLIDKLAEQFEIGS